MRLGGKGLDGQITRLHDGTIFGGVQHTLKGVPGAIEKIAFFSAFATL